MDDKRIQVIRDGIQEAEAIGALSFTQSANMTYLLETIERLERVAAAGRMARGMLEAIAEDKESPDFSDENKWLGLKSFAREAADAYDKAVAK